MNVQHRNPLANHLTFWSTQQGICKRQESDANIVKKVYRICIEVSGLLGSSLLDLLGAIASRLGASFAESRRDRLKSKSSKSEVNNHLLSEFHDLPV